MRLNNEHIDELIGKLLAGEATTSEHALITDWLEESEENQRYFSQMKKIFEGSSAIADNHGYDTDAAWRKLKQRLDTSRGKVVPLNPGTTTFQWWKAAAAILVLAIAGIYLLRDNETGMQSVQLASRDHSLADTLPDGTDVFLNKMTRLDFEFNKEKKTRTVKLEGEAYFSIHAKKEEQFIVRSGDVFIRDIGTSFNVKAYPDSDLIEVLVEEGEVVFYTADNPGIRLKESGKGVYNKKTKEFTIDAPEPNITAYKTKFFVFAGTRLADAVVALNEVYETPIKIDDNLKNCPITVSFRNESVEEIAAVIAETFGLTITKEADGITLKGDGCE